MNICKKIHIIGRVQGVFFRAFAQKVAQDLQLTGWARNEADGSVMVLACGPSEQLDQLIKALYQGPPIAQVASVKVELQTYQDYKDFTILR